MFHPYYCIRMKRNLCFWWTVPPSFRFVPFWYFNLCCFVFLLSLLYLHDTNLSRDFFYFFIVFLDIIYFFLFQFVINVLFVCIFKNFLSISPFCTDIYLCGEDASHSLPVFAHPPQYTISVHKPTPQPNKCPAAGCSQTGAKPWGIKACKQLYISIYNRQCAP